MPEQSFLQQCAERIENVSDDAEDWICGEYPEDAITAIVTCSGTSGYDDNVADLVQMLHREIERLNRRLIDWEKAFYREERRAVNYHNLDASCGHPLSCIRNTKDGARCLMCLQDDEIKSLKEQVENYRLARDAAIDDYLLRGKEIEKLQSLIGEDTTGRSDGYTTGKAT